MTHQSIVNPNSLRPNFEPSRGIYFNQRWLNRDLADVIGGLFNGKALKESLENQWSEFVNGAKSEVWYQKAGTDEWEKQSSIYTYPQQLLMKNRASFGLLFETPFVQLATSIYVFMEIQRNPKSYYRASFPFVAEFSIRDEHANRLEPMESIVGDAEGMTRAERFRILVHNLRYFDNAPIVEEPSLLLSSLGRIACSFDERDLAQSLQTDFGDELARVGSVGDFPLLCYTNLQTEHELIPVSMPTRRVGPGSKISLLFMKGFKVHVLFGDDIENGVPISDFYPAIDRFLNRKSSWFDLHELAELSERRNWDFSNDDGNSVSLGSLNYYLELTFGRITEDIEHDEDCQEIVTTEDETGKLFCTGLRHRKFGSYIYACCTDPDDNGVYQKVKWVFGVGQEGNRSYPPELVFQKFDGQRNHGLPYPANWTREPEKLVFQYQSGSKSDIHFRFKHMYEDHLDRIKFDGTDATGIGDNLTREEFEQRIKTAWPTTRKLLEANYKNAIPTYYQGDIQLLVPLFLDKRKPSTPSAALVLARDRTGKRYYYAPTFLTLEMARNNALVITRIDDSWLTPNPIPGTISWLQGQLVDETNDEKKEAVCKAIKDLTALL